MPYSVKHLLLVRLIWWILLSLYAPLTVHATTAPSALEEIWVSASVANAQTQAFTEALAKQMPLHDVSFIEASELKTRTFSQQQLIILGTDLLKWRLALSNDPPTLALQITRSEFKHLWPKKTDSDLNNLTLLWSDPSLIRQMYLLKILLPYKQRLGILFSKDSANLIIDAKQAADELGLSLIIQHANPTNIGTSLNHLLPRIDILLGVHDDSLYNSSSIKSILLSSYNQQIPMIGPSASFINAGSLATTYSSQSDWMEVLEYWLLTPVKDRPAHIYPHIFSVMTNKQVARSLGLTLPSEKELLKQLQEQACP